MNIGPAEIIVVLVIALLVVGPARLPEMARKVGGGLRELRAMQATFTSGIDGIVRDHVDGQVDGEVTSTARVGVKDARVE